MTFLRYLVIILAISYLYWYINSRFLARNYSLVKIIAYVLVGFSAIGVLLWGLSFLIEGH